MLGTNEIQEAIHRTTNSEKLEADLISALNHVIGQFCHIGKHCRKYYIITIVIKIKCFYTYKFPQCILGLQTNKIIMQMLLK